MKRLLFIVSLVTACYFGKAQSKSKHADTKPIPDEVPFIDDNFTRPSFPGGLKQFYKYLVNDIHYPPVAVKSKIQGKVYLDFVVEKDGSVDNIKVVRGVSKEINAEAIRVLKNSPKWTPGTHYGKPEPVHYRIPMNFELPKTKQKGA